MIHSKSTRKLLVCSSVAGALLLGLSFGPECRGEQGGSKPDPPGAAFPDSAHLKRGPEGRASNDKILLEVRGNLTVSSDLLLEALDLPQTEEKDDLEWVVREQIQNLYRKHGLIKASIDYVSVLPGDPLSIVEIHVNEGDVYRYGEVEFEGIQGIPIEEVRALMPSSGTRVDLISLKAILMDLLRLYKDHGFLDTRFVGRMPSDAGSGEADFRLGVEEGPQYRIRSISCPPTLKLPLKVGQPFSKRLLLESLKAHGLSEEHLMVRKDRNSHEIEVTVLSTQR